MRLSTSVEKLFILRVTGMMLRTDDLFHPVPLPFPLPSSAVEKLIVSHSSSQNVDARCEGNPRTEGPSSA